MTMPSDDLSSSLPQSWQDYVPFVTSVVRQLLTLAGGAGFTWALTVNASQVQMGVSAAMVATSVIWSQWQKLRAKQALRRAAAAPAMMPAPKLPA